MSSWLSSMTGGAENGPAPAPRREVHLSAAPAPSETAAFVREPVPLIEVDDEGKFTVNDGARAILEPLRGKVCVVSVAGLYRTGKSSLVNFLLETDAGFAVGPTVRRCTRGIWLWGAPRRAALPSGEPCWVVVLDTEGLGGLEADKHYDTRIFSLATLLCSTLVYNSLGSIDEGAISNLSFVANLSQHVKVSEAGDAELEAHEFHKFFPSFVWVVRDFALDLVDEYGTEISSDEYLEKALAAQVGFDAATTERNRVRSMMTAFFTERRCFPLVRPLQDEAQLQEIDKAGFGACREEFRDGVESLKAHLYETNLRPKEIHGRPVSGAAFVGLCEQYIAAIEGGGVPTISTAWEEVMARECADARDAGLAAYDAAMAEAAPAGTVVEAAKLWRGHARASKTAAARFRARAGGDQAPRYLEELEEEAAARFSKILDANEDASRTTCEAEIKRLHAQLVAPKCGGDDDAHAYADVASLRYDVQTVAAKYAAAARGPARDGALGRYALGPALDAAQWLFEKVDDTHEKTLAEAEAAAAKAAGELAAVEAREKVVQDALEQQQRELVTMTTEKMAVEARGKAAEVRVSTLLQQVTASTRKREELEQDLEDAKEALDSEQTWQAQLHKRLEEMEVKSGQKESQLNELTDTLTKHKSEAETRAEALEAQKKREKELRSQLSAAEARTAEEVRAKKEEADAKLRLEKTKASLEAERDAALAKAADLASKKDRVNETLAETRETVARLEGKLSEAVSAHGASAKDLEAQLQAETRAKVDAEGKHEAAVARGAELDAERSAVEKKLDAATRTADETAAELEGAKATHAELLRAHAALGTEHRAFQQKMNQRITYLKSQLDEHQSAGASTTTELQRKAVREAELEKRLDAEVSLRSQLSSDKDTQVLDLQKKLAEATTRLRQAEGRAAALKASLESSASELNAIAAQRAVLLDEKEKMQALWEKSLTDHFHSLHETQTQLDDAKSQSKASGSATEKRVRELEASVEEYRAIVEQVQTRKEGLLRKKTRSRLVKQTWHVKLFKLVGNALLHRDADNGAAGEKSWALDASTKVETVADATAGGGRVVRNSFKVVNGSDELLLAAIDRVDMAEWVSAIKETVADLSATAERRADQARRFANETEN